MKMRTALAVALALATASPMTSAVAQGPMSTIRQSAPASDVLQTRDRGLGVALGIGAVVGTAIILSEAARAEGHRRYRRSSYCGNLLYDCEDGVRWACRKYQDRC
jgi:hypothetical protein